MKDISERLDIIRRHLECDIYNFYNAETDPRNFAHPKRGDTAFQERLEKSLNLTVARESSKAGYEATLLGINMGLGKLRYRPWIELWISVLRKIENFGVNMTDWARAKTERSRI